MALPVDVIESIRDICHLVEDNPTLRNGEFKARAIELGKKIDQAARAQEDLQLSGPEVGLVVELAEILALAVVNGARVNAATVVMRVCERVIVPITDALGYPGDKVPNHGA
jgi:hypothetical protein